MTCTFRDRLEWMPDQGELRDRDIRYMLIRPDSLMGLFRNLEETERPAVFAAFVRSVAEHGRDSVESYRDLGAEEAGELLRTTAETAAQLGWGLWTIQSDQAAGTLSLTVGNSPFAEGHGPSDVPVCAAITGIVKALAELIYGEPAICEEVHCAAQGNTDCRFDSRLRSARKFVDRQTISDARCP